MFYPHQLEVLIATLTKLPSIGRKTAERLAFHLISRQDDYCEDLSKALTDAHSKLILCDTCKSVSETAECYFCSSDDRNDDELLIVQFPQHVFHIESSGFFKGRYHVLHGLISPLDGVYADDLSIPLLLERVRNGSVKELIFGLNPTLEGEATSRYIKDALADHPVRITRFAIGMPSGADLEYTDLKTVIRAVQGRTLL